MDLNKAYLGEILKDAPIGLELYSPCYGWLKLHHVDDDTLSMKRTPMIVCKSQSGNEKKFFMDGRVSANGECMLYPSDNYRRWEAWQTQLFKPGVIISCDYGKRTILFKSYNNLFTFEGINSNGQEVETLSLSQYHYANMAERADFLENLASNGLKWDTTEKRLVIIEEDKIQEVKKVIIPKFDVSTLRPFDKILFVHPFFKTWKPAFVSSVYENKIYIIGSDKALTKCIPYEGNEHLIDKTEQPEHYYITNASVKSTKLL